MLKRSARESSPQPLSHLPPIPRRERGSGESGFVFLPLSRGWGEGGWEREPGGEDSRAGGRARGGPFLQSALISLVCLLALAGCEREERRFRELPPSAARGLPVRVSVLQPGTPLPGPDQPGPYAANAYGISEGKRLYQWYNCSGCHFQGGGGIGPPLMDAWWIYGSEPENIRDTIVEGRPNGMPSYGGHIPDDQVWKIVAYVRSMSGMAPKAASPGRGDHMAARPSEQRKKPEEPVTEQARAPG